jgi:DNA-binding NarL/FixJ family response regulator
MQQASVTQPRTRLFLIVEDDELVARALHKIIRPFGDVVIAADFDDARRHIEDESRGWTAMLIDKSLPGGSGIDLLPLARQRWPLMPIVLMTGFNEDAAVNVAHDLGVAYVTKPWTPERVRRFASQAASRLTRHEFDLRIIQVVDVWAQTRGLSLAETDILRRASLGETQEEIAVARQASEETVRKQIAGLRLKLGCGSLHDAVLRVLREACGP